MADETGLDFSDQINSLEIKYQQVRAEWSNPVVLFILTRNFAFCGEWITVTFK